ncbi:MAG: hypothetical protein ACRDV8_04130 [Acidimicrobiales bacterium]
MGENRKPVRVAVAASGPGDPVKVWGTGSQFGQYLLAHARIDRPSGNAVGRVRHSAGNPALLPAP